MSKKSSLKIQLFSCILIFEVNHGNNSYIRFFGFIPTHKREIFQ